MASTQDFIRSYGQEKFDNADLFRGIVKVDRDNIGTFNPMVGGYARFFWINPPLFVEKGNQILWERFRNYTEKAHKSFDGINDMTVNSEDMVGGIAGNSFKIATNMKDDFDTFTIKVYETQGSPMREALSYWLTGIRDPRTGYATYKGLLGEGNGKLQYSNANHTAELMYVVTDPSGLASGIEYAALIANIVPTKIPKSHLNLNHGDHALAEMDLEFTGVKYESSSINQYARKILEANPINGDYWSFDPGTSKRQVFTR